MFQELNLLFAMHPDALETEKLLVALVVATKHQL